MELPKNLAPDGLPENISSIIKEIAKKYSLEEKQTKALDRYFLLISRINMALAQSNEPIAYATLQQEDSSMVNPNTLQKYLKENSYLLSSYINLNFVVYQRDGQWYIGTQRPERDYTSQSEGANKRIQTIHEENTQKVLKFIKTHFSVQGEEPLKWGDVGKGTGLLETTVKKILNELISEGVLIAQRDGIRHNSPILYTLNPDYGNSQFDA